MQASLVAVDEHAGGDMGNEYIAATKCVAWHLQGTTRYFAHAAFVPLTPATIVALERILRNYTEWGK
jgi:hypothetical protein